MCNLKLHILIYLTSLQKNACSLAHECTQVDMQEFKHECTHAARQLNMNAHMQPGS